MNKLIILYGIIFFLGFILIVPKIEKRFLRLRKNVYTYLSNKYGEQTIHGIYAFFGGVIFALLILCGLLFIVFMKKYNL
jgi:hypothetical protein